MLHGLDSRTKTHMGGFILRNCYMASTPLLRPQSSGIFKFPFANISKCGPSKGLNILSNHCFMPLGKNSENSGVDFQNFKSACPRHFYSTLHIVG